MKPTAEQRRQASENGISYETLLRRLAEGWPMKQAISIPVNAHRTLTDEEIKRAAENGISYITLHSRVSKYGWEIERAVTTPIIPRSERAKMQKSKIPQHLKEKAFKNGIPHSVLYHRLFVHGWDQKRAVTQPLGKKPLLTEEQNRKRIENGISIKTVHSRIYRYGWNADKAVTVIPTPRRRYSEKERALMVSNGITPQHLSERINKLGWSLEKALSTPVRNKKTS